MNQYVWYLITQLVALFIAFASATLLERRRLRTSGNFEQKQSHYADLFDVLYKVTKGLQLWHTSIFVTKDVADLDSIQRELNSTDVLRLDALNQIWASPEVIDATEKWIEARRDLGRVLSNFQGLKGLLSPEQRTEMKLEADAARKAMVLDLERVKNAIRSDLFLT